MKLAGMSARRRASDAPAFSMMGRAALSSRLAETAMEPRALSIGAGSCPKAGRQISASCAKWESVEAALTFPILAGRVESNTPVGDNAVTNARRGLFEGVNRLKQKAKGCPADRIAPAHNNVGLTGVRIELQGRGNAQNQQIGESRRKDNARESEQRRADSARHQRRQGRATEARICATGGQASCWSGCGRCAGDCTQSRTGEAIARHDCLFQEMPGQARLRAERPSRLRFRYGEAGALRRHVQRSDARRLRSLKARARDDRGSRVIAEPLLLLPYGPWGRGQAIFRQSIARRASCHELS